MQSSLESSTQLRMAPAAVTCLQREAPSSQLGEHKATEATETTEVADTRGFWRRWKERYTQDNKELKTVHGVDGIATKFFLFNALSGLYVSLRYIVPWLQPSPSQQWLGDVLCAFLVAQALGNWFLVRYTRTKYIVPASRPQRPWVDGQPPEDDFGDLHHGLLKADQAKQVEPASGPPRPASRDPEDPQRWLARLVQWRMCELCRQPQPPRAHHCYTCQGCIVKRDHHCYMTGRCIGHRNQRFFLVLVFYLALVCALGIVFEYRFLRDVYGPHSSGWTDFVLPVSLLRAVIGHMPWHVFFMVCHMYTTPWVGALCAGFTTMQFIILFTGQTSFEFRNKVKVDKQGILWNFRSVFGHYWLLNFVFPAHWLFPQHGDGTTWVRSDVIERFKKKL